MYYVLVHSTCVQVLQSPALLCACARVHLGSGYKLQVHAVLWDLVQNGTPCPKLDTYIRLYIVVLDTHRRALLGARPWRYALTIPERNVMQPHAADLRPDPETWSQEGVFKDESPVTIFL